jgi:predicted GIY-YIG superfamily endonuclease
MKKHWWLYVLKLEQGKYYVGITSKTPEERFSEHKNKYMAARWTKKYKPLEIFYKQDLGFVEKEKAELFEDRVTREYMQKYGKQNVRGGDLTSEDAYVWRFGRIFEIEDWRAFTVVVSLLCVVAYLLADKYLY